MNNRYPGVEQVSRGASGVLIAAALAGFSGAAWAGDWYAAVSGGGVKAQTVRMFAGTTVVKSDFDSGLSFSGAVGKRIERLRAEGEVVWWRADVDTLKNFSANPNSGGGDFSSAAAMANLYYDFPGLIPRVTPYLGVGAGLARVQLSGVGAGGATYAAGNDTVLAFQFKAGIAYEITANTNLTLGYRLFGTQTPELRNKAGADVEADGLLNQHVEAGLRYQF